VHLQLAPAVLPPVPVARSDGELLTGQP